MSPAHRAAVLIVLGVLAIVGGLIVVARNLWDADIDVLAAGLVVGGIAMIVVALPRSGSEP